MSDKRLYPNTVIFKGTDDNEITYINERVIEQIRQEIEEKAEWYNKKLLHEHADLCNEILQIIDKYTKGAQE